jgi:hypothetical protein
MLRSRDSVCFRSRQLDLDFLSGVLSDSLNALFSASWNEGFLRIGILPGLLEVGYIRQPNCDYTTVMKEQKLYEFVDRELEKLAMLQSIEEGLFGLYQLFENINHLSHHR